MNTLHPNISMQVLHTVHYTFPMVLKFAMISFILMTLMFDLKVTLMRELKCLSLLEVKKLNLLAKISN